MENSVLATLTALLLLCVREGTTNENSTTSETTITKNNCTDITREPCPVQPQCQNITHTITLPPALARVKIIWNKERQCEGRLYLSLSNKSEAHLCDTPKGQIWKNELCKQARCGDFEMFTVTSEDDYGYSVNSNMTVTNSSCIGLNIICKDTLGRELAAYKTVTGILLFLILSAILLQFSRPTYKAIRKRFSQKRQNQWIGPTQSQSVSYHRGQAGGQPNNNTVKRQSYPGLEKLTVNHSREPSSNRNSDYDSFGYN